MRRILAIALLTSSLAGCSKATITVTGTPDQIAKVVEQIETPQGSVSVRTRMKGDQMELTATETALSGTGSVKAVMENARQAGLRVSYSGTDFF